MHKFLSFHWAASWGDAGVLVLRLALGAVFAMHGYQKLTQMGVEGVTGFLGGLGFPMPEVFAVLLIAAELGGGILLILGALTRLSAFVTGFVALMAFLTVHASHGFFVGGGGYEFIVLIFAACLTLLVSGAGRYSLDRLWFKL
ncbi:MAG: rane protein-like protein [Candidatus Adlerbacteria bacterium]|nr:rane protein-like protein [Candidatus Adlerbacteria bacterium]